MTETPPSPPLPRREPPRRTPPPEELPSLLVELEDERDRLLLRQAVLVSVIFHLVLVLSVPTLLKIWPRSIPLSAPSAADLMRDRNLTFVEMPHDNQQVSKRPDTNVISDKDRIASSRRPVIDRKTLDELRNSARPGPPGAPASPPPTVAQAPAPGAPSASPGAGQRKPSTETARLESPPLPGGGGASGGVFSAPSSPGAVIANATRAAAANPGAGGAGGNFGVGGGAFTSSTTLDITSDTMGVDFGPYLSRVLQSVRQNWYNLIPESAYPPLMKRGKVTIVFAILKDGSVAGMHYETPSGDIALDRAAYGGITASNPFPPLPAEFRGQYLALRFRFYYNPDRNDLR